MTKPATLLAFAIFGTLALGACGSAADETPASADDFAARINGGAGSAPVSQGTEAPQIAQPLPGAAAGPYSPGTATDPESATCNANVMGEFIGQEATDAVRAQAMALVTTASEVRFVQHGSDYIRPDPTNPRLNFMLDNLGIIRDVRCG